MFPQLQGITCNGVVGRLGRGGNDDRIDAVQELAVIGSPGASAGPGGYSFGSVGLSVRHMELADQRVSGAVVGADATDPTRPYDSHSDGCHRACTSVKA